MTTSANSIGNLAPATASDSSGLFAFAEVFSEHPVIWVFLLLSLAILNAVFVAAETSLLRVHLSQLEEAVDEKRKGARRALDLVRNIDPHLAACQIGITLSSIMLGALGEPFITSKIGPLLASTDLATGTVRWIGFAIGVLFLTGVNTMFGEQIPRAIASRRPVGTSIATSGFVKVFYVLFSGPVWVIHQLSNILLKNVFRVEPVDSSLANATADDLRLMVEESGRAQEVTETEQEILENALVLNDLRVRDIITPRNDVIVLNVHKTFKENLEIALESKHTRFPLVDGHLDKTLGLIHIKDLIREMQRDSPNLFAAKRDLINVAEMLPLDDLLKLFLSNRAHIALVVDEFGGAVGLVMLDDVLDQVVGEIHDEFDDEEEPGFRRIDENSFIVEGWLPLHELAAEVNDLQLEDPDVSTIGGYLTSLLGRIPGVGDSTAIGKYLATITLADERSIQEIEFVRSQENDDEPLADLSTEEGTTKEKGVEEPTIS